MAKKEEVKKEEVKKETEATVETKVVKGGKVVALPIDPLNKKDTIVKVTINGKTTEVRRGVQETVSKEVYEMLVISGYVVEG